MKANKKKYRNESWNLICGDDDYFKYFKDARFQIIFNASSNKACYDPERKPLVTLPRLYVLPEVSDTLLEDFLDEFNGVSILVN